MADMYGDDENGDGSAARTRRRVTSLAAWRPGWPRLLAAVVAGLVTGSFAAWAYYGGPFYPLSHTFGLWIVTVALLSAGQSRARAIGTSFFALLIAVIAFFYGKKVMYGIKYPGMPYAVNPEQLLEWGLLAAVAGALLGSIFCHIGAPSWAGSIGSAFAIGLLAADAYRRASNYHDQAPVVVGFAVVAIAVLLLAAVRTPHQLLRIAAWSVPGVIVGYGLISAPDGLEQLLITGSL